MKKLALLLVFVIGCFISHAQLSTKIPIIDSALNYLHQHQLFNGVALVAENGKTVYGKAFGVADISTGEKLTTRSSFNLASVSKQFVCMMTMILKEKGKLTYEDKVVKYFPAFPYPTITIRQLMTHTSGLTEYEVPITRLYGSTDTITNQILLEWLSKYKPALDFKPGEKWQYSNTAYVVLASIIEKVSGNSFSKFLEENIVKPLGLKETYAFYLKQGDSPENRVYGFRRVEGKIKPDDLIRFDGLIGDGNIYSSAEDLLTWEQALNTEKLVKKATLMEAFTPVRLNNKTTFDYGFGWFISDDRKVLSHTGGWVGFRNIIVRYLDKKQTLILLCNDGNFRQRDIAMNILTGKPYNLPKTQLIKNVRLIDGTGAPERNVAVRVVDERIHEVGELTPFEGETVTDGLGMVLSPGFIDSHSHHDWSLIDQPEATAMVSQGITTIVAGQDGGGSLIDTISATFSKKTPAVNLATFTGHATLRRLTMGGYRALFRQATKAEVEKMKKLLDEELKKGSWGLSTGLEYESAFYSSREEVMDLAKVTARNNGRYFSHIRSEDTELEDALDEIITIGKEANLPVLISHIKVSIKSKWGQSRQVLAQLHRARADGVDITADCYPYDFGNPHYGSCFRRKTIPTSQVPNTR
jgi:CubicO group peptidase (beta-lactamase class C family)